MYTGNARKQLLLNFHLQHTSIQMEYLLKLLHDDYPGWYGGVADYFGRVMLQHFYMNFLNKNAMLNVLFLARLSCRQMRAPHRSARKQHTRQMASFMENS